MENARVPGRLTAHARLVNASALLVILGFLTHQNHVAPHNHNGRYHFQHSQSQSREAITTDRRIRGGI